MAHDDLRQARALLRKPAAEPRECHRVPACLSMGGCKASNLGVWTNDIAPDSDPTQRTARVMTNLNSRAGLGNSAASAAVAVAAMAAAALAAAGAAAAAGLAVLLATSAAVVTGSARAAGTSESSRPAEPFARHRPVLLDSSVTAMPPNGVDTAAVSLFYGSQTGTAEEVAWELAREGRRRGWLLEPRALDETSIHELSMTKIGIFVVSTTGQGDPPLNMRRLWQEMLSASLPPSSLANLSYTVFGLGDRRYREFNYAARKLHARLGNLGAKSFYRLGLGDDQHDFGLEQELDPWAEGLWTTLAELQPPVMSSEDAGDERYEVEELGQAFQNGDGAANSQVLPDDGFLAEVVAKRSLCSESHASEVQDVWNVRLRLPASRAYAAGDVVVVWPRTEPSLVQRFVVETLERSLTEYVRIRPRRSVAASPFPSRPLSLRELFSRYLDVTAVPSRYFFHVLSLHTQDELHKKKLSEFASRSLEAKDALYEYCKRERRSAAEVPTFPLASSNFPFGEFLTMFQL
eukprot:s3007_g13.t1